MYDDLIGLLLKMGILGGVLAVMTAVLAAKKENLVNTLFMISGLLLLIATIGAGATLTFINHSDTASDVVREKTISKMARSEESAKPESVPVSAEQSVSQDEDKEGGQSSKKIYTREEAYTAVKSRIKDIVDITGNEAYNSGSLYPDTRIINNEKCYYYTCLFSEDSREKRGYVERQGYIGSESLKTYNLDGTESNLSMD